MSYADYHDDMSGIVFEDQLENTLTTNLPKERKVVVMMEYARYHSSFIEKAPTMNMKKDERIEGWGVRDLQLVGSHS